MTADATSPLRINDTRGAWAQFFAFVRRPALPDRATGLRAEAFPVVAKLLALDVLLMMVLVAAFALVTQFGVKPPRSLLEHLQPSPLLLGFIAVGAPLGEELLFRSWQSGRPGHIGALLLTLATLGLAGLMIADGRSAPRVLAALGVLAVGLGLAVWWLWSRRQRPAMRWFQRHFAWFYFGATAVFAAAHITNFAGGVSAAMLPLTLPQFAVGLMLGYLRVRFGLWASVLLHAAHNSLFILLVLAGTH
jgi:hypothetical protein